ncbi:MAG: hypothetical protein HDR12_15440 [Lachnospiraceae bacterium]|nr:hypothetical protein [Lachnospiraceae bacterium]
MQNSDIFLCGAGIPGEIRTDADLGAIEEWIPISRRPVRQMFSRAPH